MEVRETRCCVEGRGATVVAIAAVPLALFSYLAPASVPIIMVFVLSWGRVPHSSLRSRPVALCPLLLYSVLARRNAPDLQTEN